MRPSVRSADVDGWSVGRGRERAGGGRTEAFLMHRLCFLSPALRMAAPSACSLGSAGAPSRRRLGARRRRRPGSGKGSSSWSFTGSFPGWWNTAEGAKRTQRGTTAPRQTSPSRYPPTPLLSSPPVVLQPPVSFRSQLLPSAPPSSHFNPPLFLPRLCPPPPCRCLVLPCSPLSSFPSVFCLRSSSLPSPPLWHCPPLPPTDPPSPTPKGCGGPLRPLRRCSAFGGGARGRGQPPGAAACPQALPAQSRCLDAGEGEGSFVRLPWAAAASPAPSLARGKALPPPPFPLFRSLRFPTLKAPVSPAAHPRPSPRPFPPPLVADSSPPPIPRKITGRLPCAGPTARPGRRSHLRECLLRCSLPLPLALLPRVACPL